MKFVKGILSGGKQADSDQAEAKATSKLDDIDDMFGFLDEKDARKPTSEGRLTGIQAESAANSTDEHDARNKGEVLFSEDQEPSDPAIGQDKSNRMTDLTSSRSSRSKADITPLPIKRLPIKRPPIKRNTTGAPAPARAVSTDQLPPTSPTANQAQVKPRPEAEPPSAAVPQRSVSGRERIPDQSRDKTVARNKTDDRPTPTRAPEVEEDLLDSSFDFLDDEFSTGTGNAEKIQPQVGAGRVRREKFDTGGVRPLDPYRELPERYGSKYAAIGLGLLSAVGAAGYIYYTEFRPSNNAVAITETIDGIGNNEPVDRTAETTAIIANPVAVEGLTLRERRDDTINTVRALVAIGEFGPATDVLSTLDPELYGYGQIEFVEMEALIGDLKQNPQSPELLARLDSIGIPKTVSIEEPTIEQAKPATSANQLNESAVVATAEIDELAQAKTLDEQKRQIEMTRLTQEIQAARELKEAELVRQAELARQAEEFRIANEQRIEADRLAQEARLAEQARQAQEAQLAEQARQAQEAQLAEQARQAQEAQLAEQARQAEEARLAEQARQAEEAQLAEQARQAEEAQLAEQARQAEEARLAEQARQAEEARLAEQARQAEEARLAEQARQAEEARVAEQVRQAEEARLAEQARQTEEARLAEQARLASLAATESTLGLERKRQQFEEQQIELARRALEQQRAAEADLQKRESSQVAAQARRDEEKKRTAALLRQAEAEAVRRQTSQTSSIQRPTQIERQPVTDADMEFVWRQFTKLKVAVEAGDMATILALSEPSGSKVQMFLQLFENFEKVNVRITNLAAQNRSETIKGTMRIISMVRANGDVTYPSDKYRDNLLTSKRENEWSRIKW